jgi:hypothetical protein
MPMVSRFACGRFSPPPSRAGDLKVSPQTDAGKTAESGDSYRMEKALLLRHSAGLRKIIVHLVMAVTVAREFAR